jgi:hypothetical protein
MVSWWVLVHSGPALLFTGKFKRKFKIRIPKMK